jgi:2-polyprenyl-6-methoxyphenol hydroxylase-like FAD-dependent oxidoreductase
MTSPRAALRFASSIRFRSPFRESRAHGFGGETLLALDSLGLVEPMLAAAKQPLPVLRQYFGDKLVAQIDFAAVPRDPYPKMVPVFQQQVVRVLERALVERGHHVEWSTGLTAIEMDHGVIPEPVALTAPSSAIT